MVVEVHIVEDAWCVCVCVYVCEFEVVVEVDIIFIYYILRIYTCIDGLDDEGGGGMGGEADVADFALAVFLKVCVCVNVRVS